VALARAVHGLPGLTLRGIMGIPEPTDDAAAQRRQFRVLRECFDTCRAAGLPVDTLSMGMSAISTRPLRKARPKFASARRFSEGATDDRDIHWRRQHGDRADRRKHRDGYSASGIRVVEPIPAQRDALAAKFAGIGVFPATSAAAIEAADAVVLAVKPQQMRAAARTLAPHVAHVGVVVAILRGHARGSSSHDEPRQHVSSHARQHHTSWPITMMISGERSSAPTGAAGMSRRTGRRKETSAHQQAGERAVGCNPDRIACTNTTTIKSHSAP